MHELEELERIRKIARKCSRRQVVWGSLTTSSTVRGGLWLSLGLSTSLVVLGGIYSEPVSLIFGSLGFLISRVVFREALKQIHKDRFEKHPHLLDAYWSDFRWLRFMQFKQLLQDSGFSSERAAILRTYAKQEHNLIRHRSLLSRPIVTGSATLIVAVSATLLGIEPVWKSGWPALVLGVLGVIFAYSVLLSDLFPSTTFWNKELELFLSWYAGMPDDR